ncbi:MAG: hypothetical protein IT453_08050 [Planctomycetes bacterium]|nr:hypothetical protein [Planctomycetota bacterium]
MPGNPELYVPLAGTSATTIVPFVLMSRVDSEPTGLAAYFNLQAVIEGDVNNPPAYVRWSNLQSEYR